MSNRKKQTQKNNPTQKVEIPQTEKSSTPANKTEKSAVTTSKPGDKKATAATVTDKTVNKDAGKATGKTARTAEKKTETKKPDNQAKKAPEKAPLNKATTQEKRKETIQEQAKMSQAKRTPKPIRIATEPKKKGSLGTALALLLGIAGTGLGAYSFNELRLLKTDMGSTTDIKTQLTGLTDKVSGLEKKADSAKMKKQLAALVKQQAAFKQAEARFNKRISQIEQMQKGLSKSVASDINTALKSRLGAVDTLLAKVKEIELGQQGLSKNLNEVSASGQAINQAGIQRQEIGYLLRMANYKLQSEGDVMAATGLLKMAESKLLAANKGKTDQLIDSVREKLIQLSGVKAVDNDALLTELKAVSDAIPQLVVKTNKPASDSDKSGEKTEQASAETKQKSMLAKIGSVIASGVKYTPKDPSKIDISAETVLIEKRLMQADLKTAELAIQSQNKVLLAQSIQSVKDSLEKYFASDETANSIKSKLTQLSQSQLETVLPDLSDLVKQFQTTQHAE